MGTQGSAGEGTVIADYYGNTESNPILAKTWALCDDGTIRNVLSQTCLTVDDLFIWDKAAVTAEDCDILNMPKRQVWSVIDRETVKDDSGIDQQIFRLWPDSNKGCLDVGGNSQTATLEYKYFGYMCVDGAKDQYLYFRSRGSVLGSGHLVNAKSKLCMEASDDATATSTVTTCADATNQIWFLYENGELVSDQSKYCLTVTDGGSSLGACSDEAYQHWTRVLCQPEESCTDSFSLYNAADGSCLDTVSDSGKGSMYQKACNDQDDQKWYWKPAHWETPVASWSLKGCDTSGTLEYSVEVGVTQGSSHDLSKETAWEIGVEIDTGFILAESSVSASYSGSVSNTWATSSESSTTESITMSCDYNDDGTDFTGGCMWQFNMEVASTVGDDSVEWNAPIVKCTRDNIAPICPPFYYCADDACNTCTDSMNAFSSTFSSTAMSLNSTAKLLEELHV